MAKQEQAVAYLFNEKTRYQVPIYQRRYVWSEANWEALWRDITDLQDDRNHFTGTIVTKSVNSGEGDSYIIVDGQQRLTTFQIIFCVIRDLWQSGIYSKDICPDLYREIDHKLFTLTKLGSLGTSGSFSKVNSSTDENGDNNSVEVEKYQYRIFIKKEREKIAFESVVSGDLWSDEIQCKLPKDEVQDKHHSLQEAFNTLLQNGIDIQQNQSQQHRIKTAYGYFGKKITNYLVNKTDQHKNLITLLSTLLYKFFAVSATLETEDRPQQAYRSINDTGVALDEFDLLRNDLFLRAGNHNKEEEYYNEFWVVFGEDGVENHFWEKPGRTDQFLNDFLKAKLGPKRDFGKRIFHHDYKGAYTDLLKEELRGNENDKEFIEKEFQELSNYAKTYEDMEKENPTTDIGRRRQFYKDLNSIFENLDLTTIPPFMLYIANELELENNERDCVYQVLESYVLRCQLRQGVNEEKITTQRIDDLFDLIIKGNIDIRKHKAAETVAKYLGAEGKPGRKWLDDQNILNGLRRVGYQIDASSKPNRDRVWNMLCYIFYRIECRMQGTQMSFENFLNKLNKLFRGTRLKHIQPQSKGQSPKVYYSIGNLTFCTGSLTNPLLFSYKKTILSAEPNSELELNKMMLKYDKLWWDESAIKHRENILLTHFNEIWPSPEYYKRTTTTNSYSDSGSKWTSMLLPPFVVMSYEDEPQELPEINSIYNKDALFVCSPESWQELSSYIRITDSVRIKQLEPIPQQFEQLNIDDDEFLRVTHKEQATTYLTTRYGHLLEGTIEDFSKDVIHLQVREEPVIVFRNGLLEFTTDLTYKGIVKSWLPPDLFGSIECEKILLGRDQEIKVKPLLGEVQEIEVKSEFLDQSVLSRKLLSDMKVDFNLKINWINGLQHYEAHNVKPVSTWQLHQGIIKSYNPKEKFGSIETNNPTGEIYMHTSLVSPENRHLLWLNQQVEFNIAETIEGRGSFAINVRVVN